MTGVRMYMYPSALFLAGLIIYVRSVLVVSTQTWLSTIFSGAFLIGVEAAAIAPKVVIIDFYGDEGTAWYGKPEFDILARNITVPGLSRRYPDVHCTQDGEVCQFVTDEGEINAALSTFALVSSPVFDLRKSYFLLAGVAGISPKVGTLGSVAFARFSVQVALQYEFDSREKLESSASGYLPQGATVDGQYPGYIYGAEAFELNDALRQRAIQFANRATLYDSDSAQRYRSRFAGSPEYTAASSLPSVVGCDTATSDVWWSGGLLAGAFEATTDLFTNGTGLYCTTQQEDGAVIGALLRGALAHRVDFSRIIDMRTASDFDRPAPGQTAVDNLLNGQFAGYEASVVNVYRAGVQVVQGILTGWTDEFAKGITPQNYIGDIIGSLGGTPDFGPGSKFGGAPPP